MAYSNLEKKRLYHKLYRQTHKDERRAEGKRYRAKYREALAIRAKLYIQPKPSPAEAQRRKLQRKEYDRKKYLNRREYYKEKARQYCLKNSFYAMERDARRRALKLEGQIEKINYRPLFAVLIGGSGLFCNWCGEFIEPRQISFDHIKPLSKGGLHIRENLQLLHLMCNKLKAAS